MADLGSEMQMIGELEVELQRLEGIWEFWKKKKEGKLWILSLSQLRKKKTSGRRRTRCWFYLKGGT